MLPKYKEIQDPLLAEIDRRGGAVRPSDRNHDGLSVYGALANYFSLTGSDLAEKVYESNGTPRPKWENMVRWARNDLRKRGLIDGGRHGVWALSEKGRLRVESSKQEHAGRGVFLPGTEITPQLFQELQRKAKEIGELGELFVLEYERARLRKAGKADLAELIRHVALTNTAAGYDVLSFTNDGNEKLIEVKSSTGTSGSFEISSNEWSVAKQSRSAYWVYRVTQVETQSPSIEMIQDPFGKFEEGAFMLVPTGFRVIPRE